MATYIEMPKLSDTMTEGVLVKWRKKEGDKVEAGDVLAEVETDKATMEMECFDDGILHQHLVPEGTRALCGSLIAIILAKGEQPPAPGSAPASATAVKPTAMAVTSVATAAGAPAAPAAATATGLRADGERIKISPLAKKLATEKGVDIASLKGTGPGGRIVAADVSGAKASASPAAVAGSVKASAAAAAPA